jgi:hypothetical protein
MSARMQVAFVALLVLAMVLLPALTAMAGRCSGHWG